MPRALAVVVLAVVALSPAAADAKRKPPRCPALKGTIVLGSKQLKVVRKRDRDGFDVIYGCAKPHGRVHLLGREEDEGLGSGTISAVEAKGTWVLIGYTGANQYASWGSNWLADAATGRRNYVFSSVAYTGDPGYDHSLDALYWDELGRAVTIIGTPSGHENGRPTGITESVSMHAPDSTKVTVDSGPREEIPPSSLSFENAVARWTHGGEQRTAIFG
jgi:hypothetical protein